MTDDIWAEASPDERVERTANRLMHLFGPDTLSVREWETMSEAGRESWRAAARQVLQEADKP